MARIMYTCDCGFTTDAKNVKAIAQHETTCSLAKEDAVLDDLKVLVAYFLPEMAPTALVANIAKGVLQVDEEITQFFEESMTDTNTSMVALIKALYATSLANNLESRIEDIERKLEIAPLPITEEHTETFESEVEVDVEQIVPSQTVMEKLSMAAKSADREG